MPVCGFTEGMLEGLTAFNKGLVEHGLMYRSEQNGETIEQGIKREISDITRLLVELPRIDDSAKRMMTEGIVKYAMGFYLIMNSKNIQDYQEVIRKINDYFHFMDDKYYSELEGRANDMRDLTKFLNDKEI